MTAVGRRCTYCGKPIAAEDRVAVCDRCYAAHHEECWDRNGRCSTFRCGGAPRKLMGADLGHVLQQALEQANAEPRVCPFCGGEAYAGVVQSTSPVASSGNVPVKGLMFVVHEDSQGVTGWLQRLTRKRRTRGWVLPGAAINARSCGRCRRLYLWGLPVEDVVRSGAAEPSAAPFCPRCGEALVHGALVLTGGRQYRTQFVCSEVPRFHADWFGHNILDRYVLNRWSVPVASIPAHSCAKCRYTEVGGRPVYHFM
ncbi:MAG: RING finger protein [Chthonomonadales bacterium]